MKYEVYVADGCFCGPDAPLVSRHRTLRGAVKKARTSDRLVATVDGRVVYSPPVRGDRHYGGGRLGNGPQKGEPSLRDVLRDVLRALGATQ